MNSVAVVGMDIHKKFSKVVMLGAGEEVLDVRQVCHGEKEEMLKFFEEFIAGTDVVMEATFNWQWISDLAKEAGLCVHLADAGRAREMAKGMAKSDRKDATFLGKLFLAGEIFPEVYLAPDDVRRRRGLFRLRLMFVRIRTAVKNCVHGQLFRLGYVTDEEASDLFGVVGRKYLKELGVNEHERGLLDEKLKVIDELDAHIGDLAGQIEKELKEDKRATILMSIPGVGKITAYTILAEMGETGRFANGRALAAYAGVLPLERESAGKDFGRHTGMKCNRYLRSAAIEAAFGAVRGSGRMSALYERVRNNKNAPGKARVAVAREIMELSWLLLKRNERYREDVPERPGTRRSQEENPHRASQTTLCARS